MRKLHWHKFSSSRWETDEGWWEKDGTGTPDYYITKHNDRSTVGVVYRLKSRTARIATLFDTLAEAKRYAGGTR